ncbi:hypothetical protein FQN49_001935 [Arthroderma sp. PD_2]|nr:hypothetical protein FQN49_001935 [Arthroderma sp. PD_2]
MSLSQTYVLAHTARAKLSREAARADHELRLLVGHANMLDNLMVELAEAEREREAWFNQNIRARTTTTTPIAPAPVSTSNKRIQWLDTVVRQDETASDEDEDWDVSSDSDSDDSSDYETDGDFFVDVTAKTAYPAPSDMYPIKYTPATTTTATSNVYAQADFDLDLSGGYGDDGDDYDDYDDGDELALTRTPSRQHQPPELLHDSDEESEDEMLPLSPPQLTFDTFSASESDAEMVVSVDASDKGDKGDVQTPTTKLSEAEQSSFVEDGFYLPARTGRTQMIAAY